MGFWRDKTMDTIEGKLGLKGEYREDQSGYAWIANREFDGDVEKRTSGGTTTMARNPKWFKTPDLVEDWRRMYWTLYTLLEKNPDLIKDFPDFKEEPRV